MASPQSSVRWEAAAIEGQRGLGQQSRVALAVPHRSRNWETRARVALRNRPRQNALLDTKSETQWPGHSDAATASCMAFTPTFPSAAWCADAGANLGALRSHAHSASPAPAF